jgi:hypothetical protein
MLPQQPNGQLQSQRNKSKQTNKQTNKRTPTRQEQSKKKATQYNSVCRKIKVKIKQD